MKSISNSSRHRSGARGNANTDILLLDICQSQSLDTDVQGPFYSVATVALLPFLNMGRERRWPR